MTLPSLGEQIVEWQMRNLVHGPGDRFGEPYEPDPWMVEATIEIFRYDPETLRRPVKRVLIGIGKGNAKTEWAAALTATLAAGPVVPTASGRGVLQKSPDIPIGAASRDQANLCFGDVGAMIQEGPLRPFFDVYQYEIRFSNNSPGRIYRIAAEAGTNDGTLPTAFVADEVHEWIGSKARVHEVVTNSLAKRASGLEINITTAGDPELSKLLLSMYEYGRRVNSGEIEDPSFYMKWFEPSDPQVPLDDPEKLRKAIREANPSTWVDVERLAKRIEGEGAIRESVFRRYHLNQWVTTGESFIPQPVWDSLGVDGTPPEDGTPIVAAFDGSHSRDSTAIIGATLEGERPRLFEIGVWERPPEARQDWRVDRQDVDRAVEEMFTRWDVVEYACDPAKWGLYIDDWRDRYGDDRVLDYPNTVERMVPATAKFYQAAVEGGFEHDRSPVLTRHVRNAVVKETSRGFMVKKDHPNRKIDAAVAGVMAHDRATWRREQEPEVVVELW